ncbi:GNAT family N-acetyltransferase [Sulfurospirillum halorespirans]|uniref:Putative acyltransferase n=1 Tax=Sulfurospirillum halorespirans DSM 13726 TaxID=1193502 RepID=A0A1D7TFS1_9BACT|nr:GNAT family N-acetyltransferase [Sulfurospirillum halorespirans]AOO63841.1 putative acyltransferase [Sulfurospirillum halorespirans DSM 13726]
MKIAKITKNDLPQLSTLFMEFIGIKSNLDKMSSSLDVIMANPNYSVLGAKIDGDLVGSAMGIICFDLVGECQPFMVIENVVVAEHARGKGVGKALVSALESEASKAHSHYIMLVSSASRVDAHGFYKSQGYDTDGFRGFKKYIV